jgi:hypothetical protein
MQAPTPRCRQMRQLSFHLGASQRGLEAAAVLMALYAGAHATLPTDATA